MLTVNGFKATARATTAAIALALAGAPMTMFVAQTAQAQATQEFSGEQIDAFAVALLEVSKVRDRYNAVLQRAETEDQQRAVIDEANTEILGAIENTEGVTVEEYRSIAEAAQQDQELNDRIMDRVRSLDAQATD